MKYEKVQMMKYQFVLSIQNQSIYLDSNQFSPLSQPYKNTALNLFRMTSQDRFKKNQSSVSTHHMSYNLSHATNFCERKRPTTAVLLNYAHLPMPKQNPKWNQSATTWRHTAHKYSFSKDTRFKDNCSYYSDILRPDLPSSLTAKSCSFGRGNGTRKPVSDVVMRNAREKPGPDRYDMRGVDDKSRQKRGKSFGLAWNHYQRNYIKHRKDPYAEFHSKDNPAPKYEVRQTPGGNKNKYTAYGRLKMYTQRMADDKSWVPGPYHKVNDRAVYGTVGLSERSFGFGERVDLSKPLNENPGAMYKIEGFCDRFSNIKDKKENRKAKDIPER